MVIPEDHTVISHKHNYDHMSILAEGTVIVEINGKQNTYFSPEVIEIKAGVEHSITAVNGQAVWFCIHATDCTDIEKVDNVLIQKLDAKMQKQPFSFYVDDALEEINKNPELWNKFNHRRDHYKNSPHEDVLDIWLRYNRIENFDKDHPERFSDEHESVWYLAIEQLPEVRLLIDKLLWELPTKVKLGGCLITKIPAGKSVKPHTDNGWHAEYYKDKYLVLLQSAPGQLFCFDDETHEGIAGEVFKFENQSPHWVINPSDVDRISLIISIREGE